MHVYLDNNATTPMRPEVVDAMTRFFLEDFGNASSIHWFGQQAKAAIDDARHRIASAVKARRAAREFFARESERLRIGIGVMVTAQQELKVPNV